ncbi:hypothetical protein GFS31_02040 [Leptolyngbya sp. BL0902]|nr:hypothetical protein GFS31_02040 [Leptolyngbya sp. BL0902]
MPLPSPATQPSTTFPAPAPLPAAIQPMVTAFPLAQVPTTPNAPTPPPQGGFAWWWLLPIAAGVGALGWAASRRGSTTSEGVSPEELAAASPTPAPEPTQTVPPTSLADVSPEPVPAEPSVVEPSEATVPPVSSELAAASSLEPDPWLDPSPAAAAVPEPVVADIPEPIAAEIPEPIAAEIPEPVAAEVPEPIIAETPEPGVVEEIPPVPAVETSEPPAAPAIEETPVPQPSAVPVMAVATGMAGLAAGAAGLAAGAAAAMASTEDQTDIEASKFDIVGQPTDGSLDLSTIDDGLPPLPDGYGESRIVLMPRDPQWAYAYWDTPHTHKEELRRQGGERLALRLYDVTDIDRNHQVPHGMQQCDCDELARDWYLQIPVSDRDYQVEIGYIARDGRWLLLAQSNTIRIPPIYPSDWSEDHFKTVTWEEDLRGKTLMTLVDPSQKARSLHEQMYAISQAGEADRVDGSIYGSMQHVPGSVPHVPGSAQQVAGSIQHIPGSAQQVAGSIQHVAGSVQHVAGSIQSLPGSIPHIAGSIQHVAGSVAPYQSAESSYAWGASGAGLLHGMPGPGSMVPTMSGISGMSGVGMGLNMSGVGMSGVGMSGLNMSGVGMSGVGMSGLNVSGLNMSGISGLTMSGVGFSASMPPARPRKFWLVADAELIVYGATEPDASVTLSGQPIHLTLEGTFRVHTSFPDGNIDYPIMAVAADGEQNRSIHMTFDRQTPDRQTNTKEEAQDEWF